MTKSRNETDGHFVARPKGILQIAHFCVPALAKEMAIACALRLAVNNLEDS